MHVLCRSRLAPHSVNRISGPLNASARPQKPIAEHTAPFPVGTIVSVLTTLPLAGPLDYRVPEGLSLVPGSIVAVPLARMGERLGAVWGPAKGDFAPEKTKPIAHHFPRFHLSAELMAFIDRVAGYVMAAPGSILDLVLRVPAALEPDPPRIAYILNPQARPKPSTARNRVLELGADGLARSPADWAESAGVSGGVIKALMEQGALSPVTLPALQHIIPPNPDYMVPLLSPDQQSAASALAANVKAGVFAATLLDGVTGSGKTEVYFEAIAEALRQGGQALILMPEIALTMQFLERFERRFGVKPIEWHSGLKQSARRRNWIDIASGDAKVIAGARSALFLPYPDLKLIVIDEEHDGAFKQEEGVIYHARDMAVLRAKGRNCPIVLASATPSLETWVNMERGRYGHLSLPARFSGRPLPECTLIDLARNKPERDRFLSPALITAVSETLALKEQALLFLNRRGFSPLTLCGECGHKIACPRCTSMLVEHRYRRRLMCHLCGYDMPIPSNCPSCRKPDTLKACGPGVERIAEEVAHHWPEARCGIMSSDLLPGHEAAQTMIKAIANHEYDIVIGTQLVAKGHNFPLLTLVGVVDADLGLKGADLRAHERTFQLLHQVSGRAGRAERPGRVLIQTHVPDEPVLQALATGDREAFYRAEAHERESGPLPPFARMVALVLAGPDEGAVKAAAADLRGRAPVAAGITVWGPTPAPLTVIRGKTRHRLTVIAGRSVNIQAYMQDWLHGFAPKGGIRLTIDVDPQSFL